MKKFQFSLAAALLTLLAATNASACITYQNAFSTSFRNAVNVDLNDYGRIHHDADDPNCAQAAMYSLTSKLDNHLNANSTTFTHWLDGFLVAEIYASAMRIGANGWASKDLDDQLVRLASRFTPNASTDQPSGPCGGNAFNTCMDDLMSTASAYAWMAAYMSRRPNRFTPQQVSDTIGYSKSYLAKALRPVSATEPDAGVCLRDIPDNGNYSTLCTGTLAELKLGTAETFTVNANQREIHYGFGLMTSVASAVLGLEVAGSPYAFDANSEVVIAKALMEEAQRHIDASTREYKDDCVKRVSDSSGVWYTTTGCGEGATGYKPDMIALKAFYDTRLGGIPNAGNYTSNNFNPGLFSLQTNDNGHFSYGRFETYGIEAFDWYMNARTFMPGDAFNPNGAVTISSTGLATGWVCDADMPGGRILVDFYAGSAFSATATASATDYGHACGTNGGYARSFSLQLNTNTKGLPITAYGLDYTWYGATALSCTSCSW
ncbi:MAG: hypothetical protein M3Q69_12505 [Acidobacteriota bacterium]|nr:hypothetical protein [Acidobacteriota bacterium]